MLNHVSQEFKVVNVADKIEAVHLGEAHKNVLGEEKKQKKIQLLPENLIIKKKTYSNWAYSQ